ncbi:MAG: hypothetical protein Q8Q08_06985 [Candidatus Omnitrophota bacterium]|nr:hypothetical protein [Candidatus Omnitrophota bacterium]MDZ4242118.1 hypothetical protein [Candidatus Omnitrophota bacterium]
MRKVFFALTVLVVIAVVLNNCKEQFVKSIVMAGASRVTGSKVTVDMFDFSLPRQMLKIQNLKIYNPAGFPDEPALIFPEISVEYDLKAMLKREVHVPAVVMDLDEVSVIRNKDGKLNVDSFKFVRDKNEGQMEFEKMRFDMLSLSVGRVIYKDYSRAEPVLNVYNLNIKDKTFHNITSAQQFALLILFETMKSTAIKNSVVYGAASFFGWGKLPVKMVNSLLAKDETAMDFDAGYDKVYEACLEAVKSRGLLVREDRNTGMIKARVEGAVVAVRVAKITRSRVNVTVSARKLFVPKPQVAGGVLYVIEQRVKGL